MTEWKYINDIIVSLKTGLNPRQNFRLNTPESFFPYITGKDIFNNKINVTSVTDKVDSKAVDLINKRACLEGNLLLFASTGTGTVGRMAIVDKYERDWAISETLYAIKTSVAISPHFLMYSLYSDIAKKQFEPKISKGSVPHLKIADLLKVKIPVPSLSEQTRIVGILDTFTASIENLKEQIAQRRKQFEYYRDQLLDLEGKEGVEIKTLGEIGRCLTGATPSTKEKSYWNNGIIPWMSSGEVHQGIVTSTASSITQEGYDNASTKMLPIGTIVIALAGQGKTRGSTAITAIELCTNQSLCGVVIENKKIINKYIYYYLRTRYNDLRRISSGEGTRGGLNLKMINSYPVPVAPLHEQSRIVSILDTFEASIANLEAQLSQREKQYEYYRNKLLTFD